MTMRKMTSEERRALVPLLRRLREALGLTMGEAARAHGWSAATWGAEERRAGTIGHGLLESLTLAAENKREKAASKAA